MTKMRGFFPTQTGPVKTYISYMFVKICIYTYTYIYSIRYHKGYVPQIHWFIVIFHGSTRPHLRIQAHLPQIPGGYHARGRREVPVARFP